MARTLEDLIAHGEALASEFEAAAETSEFREPSMSSRLAHAALQRAAAERHLREAVVEARDQGFSWPAIGKILGVSGEAARKRYGRAVDHREPATTSRLDVAYPRAAPAVRGSARPDPDPRAVSRPVSGDDPKSALMHLFDEAQEDTRRRFESVLERHLLTLL